MSVILASTLQIPRQRRKQSYSLLFASLGFGKELQIWGMKSGTLHQVRPTQLPDLQHSLHSLHPNHSSSTMGHSSPSSSTLVWPLVCCNAWSPRSFQANKLSSQWRGDQFHHQSKGEFFWIGLPPRNFWPTIMLLHHFACIRWLPPHIAGQICNVQCPAGHFSCSEHYYGE